MDWIRLPKDLQDVSDLVENNHLDGIKFYDSNFFMDTHRALEFAKLVRDEHISWAASAHPANLLSLDHHGVELLKESGLKRLLIGAESGVQEELDFIGKRIRVSDITELAELLERNEIIGSFTFVIGYPGMPAGNLKKTLQFAEKLATEHKGHEYKIHLYLPFPGTPMYERAISFGFKPPASLNEWANLDYYEQNTPWVSKEDERSVRSFNETFCPYV